MSDFMNMGAIRPAQQGFRPTGIPATRPAGLGGSLPVARGQGPGGSGGAMHGSMRTGGMQPRGPARPWEQGLRSPHNSPYMSQPAAIFRDRSGGVRPGNNMMGGPSVPPPQMNGPSLQQIQAEMARRQVGAQLGPRNGALAGYMMG